MAMIHLFHDNFDARVPQARFGRVGLGAEPARAEAFQVKSLPAAEGGL